MFGLRFDVVIASTVLVALSLFSPAVSALPDEPPVDAGVDFSADPLSHEAIATVVVDCSNGLVHASATAYSPNGEGAEVIVEIEYWGVPTGDQYEEDSNPEWAEATVSQDGFFVSGRAYAYAWSAEVDEPAERRCSFKTLVCCGGDSIPPLP